MASQARIPNHARVVVADGTRALHFRADVGRDRLSLTVLDEQAPDSLLDDGPSGKRPPEQTGQQTDEATFAKQLARTLNALAHADAFSALVLIADPQTLGQLRPILHGEVKSRLIAEIDKTMTTMPVTDIEKALSERQAG